MPSVFRSCSNPQFLIHLIIVEGRVSLTQSDATSQVSRDVLGRWAFPCAPDTNVLHAPPPAPWATGSTYRFARGNVYRCSLVSNTQGSVEGVWSGSDMGHGQHLPLRTWPRGLARGTGIGGNSVVMVAPRLQEWPIIAKQKCKQMATAPFLTVRSAVMERSAMRRNGSASSWSVSLSLCLLCPLDIRLSEPVRAGCREHDVSVARGAVIGHDSCIGAHTVIEDDSQVGQRHNSCPDPATHFFVYA